MDIAQKTKRLISREDSQHDSRQAPEQDRPDAIVRLRSLLRGKPQSARAAETAYFTEPEPGGIVPAPSSDPDAETGNSAHRQAAPVPESYEAMTVPELREEIHARNEIHADDPDRHLAVSGNKADLIERLRDDDKVRRSSE